MKSVALSLILVASLFLTGCVTLGPQIKDRMIPIETTTKKQRVVEVVQIAQDATLECWVEDKDTGNVFRDKLDVAGWKAVRPDIAKAEGLIAPRIAVRVELKVILEDGSNDWMQVGGWYVVNVPLKDKPAK